MNRALFGKKYYYRNAGFTWSTRGSKLHWILLNRFPRRCKNMPIFHEIQCLILKIILNLFQIHHWDTFWKHLKTVLFFMLFICWKNKKSVIVVVGIVEGLVVVVVEVVVVVLVTWIPLRLSYEELNTREKRQRQGGSLDRTATPQSHY